MQTIFHLLAGLHSPLLIIGAIVVVVLVVRAILRGMSRAAAEAGGAGGATVVLVAVLAVSIWLLSRHHVPAAATPAPTATKVIHQTVTKVVHEAAGKPLLSGGDIVWIVLGSLVGCVAFVAITRNKGG